MDHLHPAHREPSLPAQRAPLHQYIVPVEALLVPDAARIDGAVANIIEDQNAAGGRFVGQIQAAYWEKPGCLAGLFGKKAIQRQRILLVFEQVG